MDLSQTDFFAGAQDELPVAGTKEKRKPMDMKSTRIKDAGIAIRHSRGYIISILQGPEMGLRG